MASATTIAALTETALLSTCNRTEIYAVGAASAGEGRGDGLRVESPAALDRLRGEQRGREQGGAAQVIKLISVDLERKAHLVGGAQDGAGLLDGEGACLAEDIHKWQWQSRGVSPPPLFEHREHRLADEVGVGLRVVFIFGRDGMRTEEGGEQL